jgi:riboflavin synthase alpha subunit
MFTGIVTEIGRVTGADPVDGGRRLTLDAPHTATDMDIGESVAINGVCLTVVEAEPPSLAVVAVQETLDRSNLGSLDRGDRVDLERPVAAAGGRFDGHVVQGHVDAVGTITSIVNEGDARRMRIEMPAGLAPYVVEKGSVTVDGVSLTTTAVSPARDRTAWFEVVLIPHTLEVTVLGERKVGDAVNLETDVLAKYVERLLEARA